MSLFKKIAGNYRNAGAHVAVSVEILENDEDTSRPAANYELSGLELHNNARHQKKLLLQYMQELNKKPVDLIEAYWSYGADLIVKTIDRFGSQLPPEYNKIIQNCLCVIVETKFKGFDDGDVLTIRIYRPLRVTLQKFNRADLANAQLIELGYAVL